MVHRRENDPEHRVSDDHDHLPGGLVVVRGGIQTESREIPR